MITRQRIIGFILLILILSVGYFNLANSGLLFRLVIGLSFGFVLVWASIGFAGSISSLTKFGSAQLAKALMLMFIITAILNISLLYNHSSDYNLGIFPINFGLIIGGLMFGFGMALSSCCATGSLADISSDFSRAIITIFFFGMGVFLGFSTQNTASWLKTSWISSQSGAYFKGGVYLPDLFLFDGFNGYLGATILSILFALFVVYLASKYENKRNNTTKTQALPTKMKIGVAIISILFFILLYNTHKGWSATTAFGLWFANIIMLFGVSVENIAEFTHKSVDFFNTSIFENSTSVQNFGIIFGSILVLLFSNSFNSKFIAGLKITPKGFMTFAFGGFVMGFGTRLSSGCNVGALYTPIAEFSLSGWVYLVVVVIGGLAGNYILKNYINKTCPI
jgi:uncharacterized membrane protein YedE/YeeE